ncbi:MAG: high-affnity carbon uptake protein Hat/HatR [Bacteroidota bacterium]|nr:high-affnity carbon uptake protein Hat/HatR [Bacteroidota bacterium]
MKNFKINMNRNSLSEEDIAKGKNFDQVLKNYSAMKPSFFKTPKLWFGASAVLVTTVAALLLYTKMADHIPAPPDFINPPIAAADIKSDQYLIDAESDSTIKYPGGSLIHVPANAFLDKDGKPVKGKVELHYREFKKVADVFLAGIPMTYDSIGQQFHFETAGMMEIAALQNGNHLKPNPAALITVDMVSNHKEDKFNTYYLDTITKQWKYAQQSNYPGEAPDKITDKDIERKRYESYDEPTKKIYDNLKNSEKQIAQLEKEKPVTPKTLSADKPRFSIKVDEKEFPEIATYNNMKFQVEDKSYNPTKADELWDNVEMKRVEGALNYAITFSKPGQKYTVIASPVFATKDYAAAKLVYDQKFKEYKTKLSKRKADEAKLAADLQARAKAADEKINKEIVEMIAREKIYESRMQQNELFYRSFRVADFGIWNCDCPNKLPKGACVLAKLTDSRTKKPVLIQSCYLVEKGRNAMFTYSTEGLKNFRFDPTKENMIWVVTNDLRVAIVKPDQFKAAIKGSTEMDVELNVLDRSFKSSDVVRAYLEI